MSYDQYRYNDQEAMGTAETSPEYVRVSMRTNARSTRNCIALLSFKDASKKGESAHSFIFVFLDNTNA